MKEKTRTTGIEGMGAVPWGTHLCQFYDTRQDLVDILAPYFRQGLEDNELCIWVTSPPVGEKEAEEAMRTVVPNLAQYLERGQLEIIPYTEWYLKDGTFNGLRALNVWIDKYAQALDKGCEGIRVTGNTAWLKKRDWRDFLDYEDEVSNVVGKYHMLAICTYPLAKAGASEVMDILKNHQYALVRREGKWELIENTEHKRREEALRRLEKQHQSLIDNVNGIVASTDKSGNWTFLSPAVSGILGYKPEEMIGKSAFDFILPEDVASARIALENVIREGRVVWEYENRYISKDGRVVTLSWNAVALRDEHDNIIGAYAVGRDITDYEQAEEAQQESEEISPQSGAGRRLATVQKRFIRLGFEDLDDQGMIELLLSLALPYGESRKLARKCIEEFKDLGGFFAASPQELEKVGIPHHSMFSIRLLHELPAEVLKRKIVEQPFYKSSKEVFDYLYYSMRDLKNEVFKAIYLNSAAQIIDTVDLFEGERESILINPHRIVEEVIKRGAAAIIFVHNHPSGDPTPSKSDKQLSRDLVFVGRIIQVRVLDHLIIGGNSYFSFADEGLIKKYELDFMTLKIRGGPLGLSYLASLPEISYRI